VTPQVKSAPALTAANVSPPETATGVVLFVVVLFPSSPLKFCPQQYAAPLGVSPQVCSAPALTAANVSPPETATGIAVAPLVVVLFPSWPTELIPQQYAAPLGVTPQV